VFSKPHVKSMTVQKRPASNDDCTSPVHKVKVSYTHDIYNDCETVVGSISAENFICLIYFLLSI
jgi:hypothetical protein